jgi:hypothetical protein
MPGHFARPGKRPVPGIIIVSQNLDIGGAAIDAFTHLGSGKLKRMGEPPRLYPAVSSSLALHRRCQLPERVSVDRFAQPEGTLGKHDESGAHRVSVLIGGSHHKRGLFSRCEPCKPYQKHSGMNQMLPENELAKVFIRYQEDSPATRALPENRFVVYARIQFRDEKNLVSTGTEAVDDLLVDVLVRNELHPVIFSVG